MSKHTPGPWKTDDDIIRSDNEDNGYVTVAHVLDVAWPHGMRTGDSTPANARLIAAAPELLEALHEMLGYQSLAPAEVIERARQAYRNATGEEP